MPAERGRHIGIVDRPPQATPEVSPPSPGPALERLFTQGKQSVREIFLPSFTEPLVMDGQIPPLKEPSKFFPLPLDELKAVAGDGMVKESLNKMVEAWNDKEEEEGGNVVHLFWNGRDIHVADVNRDKGIVVVWVEGDDEKTAMKKVTTVTVDLIERYGQTYSAKYIDPQVEAARSKVQYAQDVMASYGFTSPQKAAPVYR